MRINAKCALLLALITGCGDAKPELSLRKKISEGGVTYSLYPTQFRLPVEQRFNDDSIWMFSQHLSQACSTVIRFNDTVQVSLNSSTIPQRAFRTTCFIKQPSQLLVKEATYYNNAQLWKQQFYRNDTLVQVRVYNHNTSMLDSIYYFTPNGVNRAVVQLRKTFTKKYNAKENS